MTKKAIALLGGIFLLIVGTLGFLIYLKYGKNSSTQTPVTQQPSTNNTNNGNNQTGNQTPATTTPVATQNQFTKLVDGPVVSPVLFYKGTGLSYFTPEGALYKANFQADEANLAIASQQPADLEPRTNLSKILWPPQGDNFIAQFSTGSSQVWSFYNSLTHAYADLPSSVEALDWLPSGQQIYYIWLEGGKATLNLGDGDTKNWKYIADMWETDDQIVVSPDGKNIAYYEKKSANSTNPINLVSPDGKTWKTLIKDGYNYGVLWSPDSQKLLFAKKDQSGQKYQLWYYNLLTGESQNLGRQGANTLPEKALWSQDSTTVYAAVPKNGTSGGQDLTNDVFYKINTATGEKTIYDPGSVAVDGRDLFLSKNETQLLFRNAQDGSLYYLDMSQSGK